ncbi:MAG: TAXI family TRAP transporter solute-binding subunit [Myxococcota bacterium]
MSFPSRSLLATLALALAPLSSQAADYVISSGAEGGYYYGLANRLAKVLTQEGRSVEHRTSTGSLENLAAVHDPRGPVTVALAQADAVRQYLHDHTEFGSDLQVVDDVGRECVVLITRKSGGIASAADLKQGGHGAVNVGSPGSGAAVTYKHMSRLNPDFKKSAVVHKDVFESLLQMRMGPAGEKIAAVMLVKRPRIVSPPMEIVLQNPDLFSVAPVLAADVKVESLPNGKPVYSFERVTTGFGRGTTVEFDTMCTRGLLVASKRKLGSQKRSELARIMLEHGGMIAPGR